MRGTPLNSGISGGRKGEGEESAVWGFLAFRMSSGHLRPQQMFASALPLGSHRCPYVPAGDLSLGEYYAPTTCINLVRFRDWQPRSK